MKSLLVGALLLILPVAAYAQSSAPQTIEQVNNDFPRSVVVTTSGPDSARASLVAIVKDGVVTWKPEGVTSPLNPEENQLRTQSSDFVAFRSKGHLTPTAAYIGQDQKLVTAVSVPSQGKFTFEEVSQGIYLLSILVNSTSGGTGIYQTLLYTDNAEHNDLSVFEITNEPLDMVKLASGDVQ